MPCKVKSCVCSHDYQSKEYGENKRVMNRKAGDKKVYVCSVCLREHSESDGEDGKKPKK